MNKYIDNVEAKKVIALKDLVSVKENSLNPFSLVERNSLIIKILSLGKNAEVPTHSGTGETIVNAIEGEGYIFKIYERAYSRWSFRFICNRAYVY